MFQYVISFFLHDSTNYETFSNFEMFIYGSLWCGRFDFANSISFFITELGQQKT